MTYSPGPYMAGVFQAAWSTRSSRGIHRGIGPATSRDTRRPVGIGERTGGFPRTAPASTGGVGEVIAGVLAIMGGLLHGCLGAMALVGVPYERSRTPSPPAPRTSTTYSDVGHRRSADPGRRLHAAGAQAGSRWLIGVGYVPIFAFGLGAFLGANADGDNLGR